MKWDVTQAEPWKPARVYDADGVEIHFVTKLDTDTGEVEHWEHDDTLKILMFEDGPRRVCRIVPAPLNVVEFDDAKPWSIAEAPA